MKNLWALLILLIAWAISLSGCGPAAPIKAPDFEVETLPSKFAKVTLASKQGKVVLLDFWATWCGPCRMVTPVVEGLYERYRDRGLEVMAISDEPRNVVLNFEAKDPHAVPVYLDPNRLAHDAFEVQSLPTLVIIDRQGNIVFASAGFGPESETRLQAVIEKALG